MPIYLAMANPREPEPAPADDGQTPEEEPMSPENAPDRGEGGITPEQLANVIRRLETGFYDREEVREQIARRVIEELDQ
jgi:hypothetical protein